MTDIEESFASHPRFERVDDGWTPTANDWDATITPSPDAIEVDISVPTLDAVVTGEPVAPVVLDGWFETLERRLEDVDGVTYAAVSDLDVERDGSVVDVRARLAPRPGKTPDDALAIVNYVEGTWFEGVIPGYDYDETVQAMRERAQRNGQSGDRGGTPL